MDGLTVKTTNTIPIVNDAVCGLVAQLCPSFFFFFFFAILRPVASRLLCPWDSPGKNTGVGCHFLLQGIFPTQGSNLSLLLWQADFFFFFFNFFTTEPPGYLTDTVLSTETFVYAFLLQSHAHAHQLCGPATLDGHGVPC